MERSELKVCESCRRISCGRSEQIHLPGHLTELQQGVRLPLKALRHHDVIVPSGYVLVEVAVGASSEAVGPLEEEEEEEEEEEGHFDKLSRHDTESFASNCAHATVSAWTFPNQYN